MLSVAKMLAWHKAEADMGRTSLARPIDLFKRALNTFWDNNFDIKVILSNHKEL